MLTSCDRVNVFDERCRRLADQARLPTPRYRMGMRAYAYGFPTTPLLGFSVSRGNPPLGGGRTFLLRRAVHHGMMPADRYAKQRKAREKGRNGGTKERENPYYDGAFRLAHVRCDYDVRTGRLPHPGRHLGVRQQHLGAKS